MNFNLDEAIEVLERTPQALKYLLSGLSDTWIHCNEGEGTWNATEIIGHLIEAEKDNWIPRLETIVQEGMNKEFPPFDRDAHMKINNENSIDEKLNEFISIRSENISKLKQLVVDESSLYLTGRHPAFGEVTLRGLLSTWTVHDLTHISQIVRVIAKRYCDDVGPWKEYLRILRD